MADLEYLECSSGQTCQETHKAVTLDSEAPSAKVPTGVGHVMSHHGRMPTLFAMLPTHTS